jgi:hypothetical protein
MTHALQLLEQTDKVIIEIVVIIFVIITAGRIILADILMMRFQ